MKSSTLWLRNFRVLFSLSALLLLTTVAFAQDAYHRALTTRLMNSYGLPAGTLLFTDSDSLNIARGSSYGVGKTIRAITNQDFTKEIGLTVARAGANPWDAGYVISNAKPVKKGDKVLFTFAIRSNGGPGKVSIFVERSSDFQKEFYATVPIDINWQIFYISFESVYGDHAIDKLRFGLHLAHQTQDVRIGGMTAINYGANVPLSQLPSDINAGNYDGSAANAAWRAPAERRIDSLRKADLRIITKRSDGAPVGDVNVQVRQIRHEFAFGTAIKACRLDGNRCFNPIFQSRLLNLDNKGHGFNWVVFENDLKWPAWEEEWLASNEEVINAVGWLRDRNIDIRGHNLLWPGFDNYPSDLRGRERDTAFVISRIRNHINLLATTPGLAGELADWDVINETVTNVSLENGFRGQPGYLTGRELYAKVFKLARAANPGVELYLNDYVTESLGNGPDAAAYKALKRNVTELITAGAPVDGIGFQGHIGASPYGIPAMLALLDDFYDSYGLDAKITEFDLPGAVPDTLAARYLTDFLTASFSHPSMTGFFFWNFWDTDTWQNSGANLYDANWNRTKPGDAFVQKVFTDWWTERDLRSAADGTSDVRGFKGLYTVTYTCGGQLRTDTLNLIEAKDFEIVCDNFIVGIQDVRDLPGFRLSPNPNKGSFRVEHDFGPGAQVEVFDVSGRKLHTGALESASSNLSLVLPKGVYSVQVSNAQERKSELLVVQ